ncbi:hypothetical protein [Psychromonas sp. L1A2]
MWQNEYTEFSYVKLHDVLYDGIG